MICFRQGLFFYTGMFFFVLLRNNNLYLNHFSGILRSLLKLEPVILIQLFNEYDMIGKCYLYCTENDNQSRKLRRS